MSVCRQVWNHILEANKEAIEEAWTWSRGAGAARMALGKPRQSWLQDCLLHNQRFQVGELQYASALTLGGSRCH